MTTSREEKSELDRTSLPGEPDQQDDPVSAAASVPVPAFDLNDFDDEFDDDFEAEVAGEYEMEDDEYARQLVDMVDFEIEGLSEMDDEDDEPSSNDEAADIDDA